MLRPILAKAGLSNREAEVAALVATGLSNKEVADRLFVTEKTIKFHLTNIYKKMNIRSRAQLIVWCLPHIRFEENSASANAEVQQPAANSTNAGGNTTTDPNAGQSVVDEISVLTPGQYNGGRGDVDINGGAFGAGA